MREAPAYRAAIEALVADFEARAEFLEDIAVADTVLALQALAAGACTERAARVDASPRVRGEACLAGS